MTQDDIDIVIRLREGRTNGSYLRWAVTDVHQEAANEIERLRTLVVPPGWQAVPNKLTQDQLDEVKAAGEGEPFSDEGMQYLYTRMLAAAPKPGDPA